MLLLRALLVASAAIPAAARLPVGGKESTPFSRSHTVFILICGEDGPGQCRQCAGTLLAPAGNVVLSAAHCFPSGASTDPGNLIVYVHIHSLLAVSPYKQEHECSKKIKVVKYVEHPEYGGVAGTRDFDAALLFLEEAAPCVADGRTATVSLDPVDPAVGAEMRVEGWGATDVAGQSYPDTLHEVVINVMSNEECGVLWAITENMLCARAPGKDGCTAAWNDRSCFLSKMRLEFAKNRSCRSW